GNAFDASVAISAALAVVYPHMTGLGGDAFFMICHARSGKVEGYNGSGRSGVRAVPERYAGQHAIPFRGADSAITVPGIVDAWWGVWIRYGSLPWEQLLEPAIRYAEEGFPVSRNLAQWIVKDECLLEASVPLKRLYQSGGNWLAESDRLRQADLAATLRAIQRGGRETFYEGQVMQQLTAAIAAEGGLLTEEDFRLHAGEWVTPLTTSYRGYEVHQMPPNSQGFSLLMMLNMLENTELAVVSRHSAGFYHLMAEVVKRSFRERDAYLTDPAFRQIPLKKLLSKTYAESLWASIARAPLAASSFLSKAMGRDTAYAAVVDEEGNAVSFIQSLYFDFGSGWMPGGTGIVLQNRGSFFSLDPLQPNVLEPRKRTFHTLMPGMVTRGGKPFLLLGTQGGEGQPQTSLSLLTGVLDYGLSIQEAIALPRWVYGRTWGDSGDTLKIEQESADDMLSELRKMGHRVEAANRWDGIMGQAQGIMVDRGVISGAADPRGDGSVIGW
ncbi:gamma-glutamyltranspeptidase, partial [Paenibacillus darwinianus]